MKFNLLALLSLAVIAAAIPLPSPYSSCSGSGSGSMSGSGCGGSSSLPGAGGFTGSSIVASPTKPKASPVSIPPASPYGSCGGSSTSGSCGSISGSGSISSAGPFQGGGSSMVPRNKVYHHHPAVNCIFSPMLIISCSNKHSSLRNYLASTTHNSICHPLSAQSKSSIQAIAWKSSLHRMVKRNWHGRVLQR